MKIDIIFFVCLSEILFELKMKRTDCVIKILSLLNNLNVILQKLPNVDILIWTQHLLGINRE
jgi:hypothetical protein